MVNIMHQEISKQLVELQKTVDVRLTQYGYIFYDFDGSTGFDFRYSSKVFFTTSVISEIVIVKSSVSLVRAIIIPSI